MFEHAQHRGTPLARVADRLGLGTVVLLALVALPVLVGLTCGAISALHPPPKTYRFIFPEGARGEFVLRCLVRGAPSLPMENGFRLVRFDSGTRTIDTQDEYVFGNGWFREEHFVEGLSGRRSIDVDCNPRPSLAGVRVDVTCQLP